MFFLKTEERTLHLHPSFFGPNIPQYLFNELLKDTEGVVNNDYYTITVLDNPLVTMGKIIPGNGRAEYRMSYRAICWRPFKGEVVS
jgi:DNA-directed RNA polymerase II subunit RPB7